MSESEIIIDSREPWERVFEIIEELDPPEYRLEALDHKADYIIRNDNEIAIQRKEINDFTSSIGDLKDDLFELRTHHPHGALLLEGNWKDSGGTLCVRRGNKWTEVMPMKQFHNFFISQQLRGTLFFRTTCLEETCEFLVHCHGYIGQDIQEESDPQNPWTVLTMFPGIGPATAGSLKAEYRTVGRAMERIDEWDTVRGIGPKTIESVEEWLYDG